MSEIFKEKRIITKQENDLAIFLRNCGFLVGQNHTIKIDNYAFQVSYCLRNFKHEDWAKANLKVYAQYYDSLHYPQDDEEMIKVFEQDRIKEKLINKHLTQTASKVSDQRRLLNLSSHRRNTENLALVFDEFTKLYSQILITLVVQDWHENGKLAAYHRRRLESLKLKHHYVHGKASL